MLFELKQDSSERVHYLFGTMHVKDNQAYTHIEKAKICIDQCACYAAEMNLDEADSSGLNKYFFLPEGKSLYDYFSPKRIKKLGRMMKHSFGVNLDEVSSLLPIFTVNLLTEKILKDDNLLPLDQYLWQYAISQNKVMKGVESPQDQIDILQSIPIDLQIKSLKDILNNVSKFHKSTLRLSRYYAEGNVHGIYKLSKKSLGSMRKVMIYDRNFKMLDSMLAMMMESSCFMAIGAGHLSGKYGLISLLKKSKVKVKKIPSH